MSEAATAEPATTEPADRGPGGLAIGVIWILATALGAGLGVLLIVLAKPEEAWVAAGLLSVVYLAQHAALAILRRPRPLLPVLGVACAFGGGLLADWLHGQRAPKDNIVAVVAVVFSVPWAWTLSARWQQGIAWLLCGGAGIAGGSLAADAVFRSLQVASRSEARSAAISTMVACVALSTAAMAVWFCRSTRPARRAPEHTSLTPGARWTPDAFSLQSGRYALGTAGAYALALGVAILVGDHVWRRAAEPVVQDFGYRQPTRLPHNALDLGLANPVFGVLCILVGVGLFVRGNWARYALHVVAPCGALALASTHAQALWEKDVPQTIFLGPVFGVLALLVSRKGAIAAATLRPRDRTSLAPTWVRRGVPIALVMLALAAVGYLYVKGSKPRPFGVRVGMNEYVKILVVTHVALWHAIPGLLGAAIPFSRRRTHAGSAG